MERLTAYDEPFYGRADNMVLGPPSPGEAGDAAATSWKRSAAATTSSAV